MAFRITSTYYDPADGEHDQNFEIVFDAEVVDGRISNKTAFGYATNEVGGGPLKGQFVKYPFILEPPSDERPHGQLNYGHGLRANNLQFEAIGIFETKIAVGEHFTTGDGEDTWTYRIDAVEELA